MKHLFITFLTIVCIQSLHAQISVTSMSFPEAGDTLNTATDTGINTITHPNPGPNQLWNFSALDTHQVQSMIVLDASTGNAAATFPDADILVNIFNVEGYAEVNTNTVNVLGLGNLSSIIPDLGGITFPIPESVTPSSPFTIRRTISYQQTFNSSSDITLSVETADIPGFDSLIDNLNLPIPDGVTINTIELIITLNRIENADAWGTATMPYGDVEVLRVFFQDYLTVNATAIGVINFGIGDFPFNFPIPQSTIDDILPATLKDTINSYQYLDATSVEPIVLYVLNDDNSINSVTFRNVTLENLPPLVIDDTNNDLQDIDQTICLICNDSDPENNLDTSSIITVKQPNNGNVSIDNVGIATYSPNQGYVGTDTFSYSICDNETPPLCDTAIVTITIIDTTSITIPQQNIAPSATLDISNDLQGIDQIICLICNDSDPENNLDTSSITIVNQPINGTVNIDQTGIAIYTPNQEYIGTDTFSYSICDNETPPLCDTAIVIVTVLLVNNTDKIEPQEKITVSVYPNPCIDFVHLKTINIRETITVDLYNLLGNKLYNKQIDLSDGETIRLNLKDTPTGKYLLTIKNSKGNIIKTTKLIVN